MKINLSFDDASLEDMDIAETILKHGLEFNTVFFFPVMPALCNEFKGRKSLSPEQMFDIASKFEIGSHTISHRLLTRIPLDEAKTEIYDSKKILKERFNQPIKQFCYPRGYANPDIQNLVKKAGYASARGVGVGYIHESENQFMQQTTVHVGFDRKEYGGKNWFDYGKYLIAEAKKEKNSVVNLWGHGYELASYPNGLKLFDELLGELN